MTPVETDVAPPRFRAQRRRDTENRSQTREQWREPEGEPQLREHEHRHGAGDQPEDSEP